MKNSLLLASIVSLSLAACGGGGAGTAQNSTTTGATSSGQTSTGTGSNQTSTGTNGSSQTNNGTVASTCVNKLGSNWVKVGMKSLDYVIYGGGKFLGASWDGAATSTDGAIWSEVPVIKQFDAIGYGLGNFVGFVYPNQQPAIKPVYSTDGVNWSPGQVSAELDGKYNISPLEIVAGGGRLITSDKFSSLIIWSADGKLWQKAVGLPVNVIPKNYVLNWLAYANGSFFAAGTGSTSNKYQIFSSTDGNSWKEIIIKGDGIFPSTLIAGMQYIGNQYVAIDQNGVIATSRDAINWQTALNTNAKVEGFGNFMVAGAGQLMTVVGSRENSRVYYSCDGASWSSVGIQTGIFGFKLAIGNSSAVIVDGSFGYVSKF
ncbi:MAG: hypothetical protein V4495_17220 [Pseudomonadota bacterium]